MIAITYMTDGLAVRNILLSLSVASFYEF